MLSLVASFCDPLSNAFLVASAFILLFAGALGAYQLLFFIALRSLGKQSLGGRCLQAIHKGGAALVLEVAALIALDFSGLPAPCTAVLRHLIVVIIIATIGLCCSMAAHAIYHHLYQRYQKEALEDDSKRALLTQMQILYRFVLFLVVVLTVSCILITFPNIRSLGIGLLGSAGVAGLALGIAARPILLNIMAGVQIAFSKMLKIGDTVFIQGEIAKVEYIYLTHVVLVTSDRRRLFLPISDFIDKPFENWSQVPSDYLGTALLYCDYRTPLEIIRHKCHELLLQTPLWDGRYWQVELADTTEQALVVRLIMSASSVNNALQLRTAIREQLIGFLQEHHPEALVRMRYEELA